MRAIVITMLKLYFSYLVNPVFTRLNDFLKKGGKLVLGCQGNFQLSRKCIITNNCYFLKSNCVTPIGYLSRIKARLIQRRAFFIEKLELNFE